MPDLEWSAPHNSEGDRRGRSEGAKYWYLIGPDRGGRWSVSRCTEDNWWTVARDCESEAVAQIVAQIYDDKLRESA